MKTLQTRLVAALVMCGFAGTLSAAVLAPQGDTLAPAGDSAMIVAKRGADDRRPKPEPEDLKCDDKGTDLCRATVAKRGADDRIREPRPDDLKCDDHGSDLCRAEVAKKGADDPFPEMEGPEGPDDKGGKRRAPSIAV